MWIPKPERGNNKRQSTNRRLYVLIEICKPLPFDTMCDTATLNGENFTFLTEAIWNLYKWALKGQNGVRFYEGSSAFYPIAFDCSNINGYEGENVLENTYREFKKASTDDDRQGVDFYLLGKPVQLKTVGHGITEFTNNVLDGKNKRSGLSPINAKLNDLLNWEFFSIDELDS